MYFFQHKNTIDFGQHFTDFADKKVMSLAPLTATESVLTLPKLQQIPVESLGISQGVDIEAVETEPNVSPPPCVGALRYASSHMVPLNLSGLHYPVSRYRAGTDSGPVPINHSILHPQNVEGTDVWSSELKYALSGDEDRGSLDRQYRAYKGTRVDIKTLVSYEPRRETSHILDLSAILTPRELDALFILEKAFGNVEEGRVIHAFLSNASFNRKIFSLEMKMRLLGLVCDSVARYIRHFGFSHGVQISQDRFLSSVFTLTETDSNGLLLPVLKSGGMVTDWSDVQSNLGFIVEFLEQVRLSLREENFDARPTHRALSEKIIGCGDSYDPDGIYEDGEGRPVIVEIKALQSYREDGDVQGADLLEHPSFRLKRGGSFGHGSVIRSFLKAAHYMQNPANHNLRYHLVIVTNRPGQDEHAVLQRFREALERIRFDGDDIDSILSRVDIEFRPHP